MAQPSGGLPEHMTELGTAAADQKILKIKIIPFKNQTHRVKKHSHNLTFYVNNN